MPVFLKALIKIYGMPFLRKRRPYSLIGQYLPCINTLILFPILVSKDLEWFQMPRFRYVRYSGRHNCNKRNMWINNDNAFAKFYSGATYY